MDRQWIRRLRRLSRWLGKQLLSQMLLSGTVLKLLVSFLSSTAVTIWANLSDVPKWTLPIIFLSVAVLVLWTWNGVLWWREQTRLDRAISHPQPEIQQRLYVPEREPAPAQELASPYVRNRTVRIADLTKTTAVLRDRTFEDCTILGPAIFLPLGGIVQSCSNEGPIDRLFIEIPDERMSSAPVGVVYVRDCVFRRCHFSGIGFMGTSDAVAQWKDAMHEMDV